MADSAETADARLARLGTLQARESLEFETKTRALMYRFDALFRSTDLLTRPTAEVCHEFATLLAELRVISCDRIDHISTILVEMAHPFDPPAVKSDRAVQVSKALTSIVSAPDDHPV